MNNIENEIKEKRKANKNYFWFFSIITLATITIIYSNLTNSGVVSKLNINQDSLVEEKISSTTKEVEKQNNQEIIKEKIIQIQSPTETTVVKIEEKPIVVADNKMNTKEDIKKEKPLENKNIALKEDKKIEIKKVEEKEKLVKDNTKKEKDGIALVVEKNPDFNILVCTTFKTADANISKDCMVKLEEFIKVNENASKYELIGLIDLEDTQKLTKNTLVYQRRLAKQRVDSTKKFMEKKANLFVENRSFFLKNNLKDHKGVILRAYF